MAALTCPGCGATLRPANVDLSLGIASCVACDQVHELPRRAPAPGRTAPDPGGLVVVGGDLPSVSWRWLNVPLLLFLTVWCAFWDFAMVTMIGSALANGELGVLLFGSLHIAAGVFMTYYWFANALNRTTLAVADGHLRLTHGPLPWFGEVTLDVGEIEQIYVMQDIGSKGGRTWSLHAALRPGHPKKLVGGLTSAGRARALEEWLERELRIEDAPVSGEHA